MNRAEITQGNERLAELQKELDCTKSDLQVMVEELETANEELKSTNEELQSTNEELQSTNEELETAKEEQLSLNEELEAVNQELSGKIEELLDINKETRHLFDQANIPVILLDKQMCIEYFTARVKNIIPLIETDIGRPIDHLVTLLDYEGMVVDAQTVLENLTPIERKATAPDGTCYQVRVQPYHGHTNQLEGVLVIFEDISKFITES